MSCVIVSPPSGVNSSLIVHFMRVLSEGLSAGVYASQPHFRDGVGLTCQFVQKVPFLNASP